jgi:hypothetical protein
MSLENSSVTIGQECAIREHGENKRITNFLVECKSIGGAIVSRNTRITLGLSVVFSVYMIYLFWAWAVFRSWVTETFYVVPFFNFRQPGESFLSWINLIVFITLVLWVVWVVLLIKDSKRS